MTGYEVVADDAVKDVIVRLVVTGRAFAFARSRLLIIHGFRRHWALGRPGDRRRCRLTEHSRQSVFEFSGTGQTGDDASQINHDRLS
jgi:hypothetical protein